MKTKTAEEQLKKSYPAYPARLQWGVWRHRTAKTTGEGDIAASYTADRIGMGHPIRKPFQSKGCLWVCVQLGRHLEAEVYRLVPLDAFKCEVTTYATKAADAEAARQDPNGFYHGMTSDYGHEHFILCGPPVLLAASERERMARSETDELFRQICLQVWLFRPPSCGELKIPCFPP